MSEKKQPEDVICTSVHSVELGNGRTVQPSEKVKDVDVLDPHNAALLADGHLTVIEKPEPKNPGGQGGSGNAQTGGVS